MDYTRKAGLIVQQGVNDSKAYQWGPFALMKMQMAGVKSYIIGIEFYFFTLNFGISFNA
jgi:hypothetical protein